MSEWTGWDTHPNSLWGVWYQSDGLRVRWVTLQAMAGVMGCWQVGDGSVSCRMVRTDLGETRASDGSLYDVLGTLERRERD